MMRLSILAFLTFSFVPSFAQVTNQNLFDTIPFLPDHYEKKIRQFQAEPIVKGQIIFLGNSITQDGDWRDLTGIPSVINRGIGGDITFGVLKRMDDIVERKPSRLFILIGVNDIGKDIPDEVIADNIRKIISIVKARTPGTTIFLQSILPVNPTVRKFPQHYDKEQHILHTNVLLRKVASDENIRFINLYPLFLNDRQQLREDLTTDGLHLNKNGYQIWIDFLKETKCL